MTMVDCIQCTNQKHVRRQNHGQQDTHPSRPGSCALPLMTAANSSVPQSAGLRPSKAATSGDSMASLAVPPVDVGLTKE